ncbi:MAG: hypothetical protein KAU07_00790 [Candidatus Andersenbacteria bacterium]|nr:hypothetical protein [Candidatus Andersenbacteria bacterium]
MKIKFHAIVFDDFIKNVIDENGKIRPKRFLEVMSDNDEVPINIGLHDNSRIYQRHFGYNFKAEILIKRKNGKKFYTINIIP